MAVTVSMINMKGGVGKTTLASQLCFAGAAAGLRVLAVDLDPQSNLSQAIMGARAYVDRLATKKPTVVQIFDGYVPAGGEYGAPRRVDIDAIMVHKQAGWLGDKGSLHLIPSRLELSRTLKNPTGKERRLVKALARVADRFDLIVIDCAPTESILTDAACFASRYVIVPVKPEFMATIGLPLLARSIQEFRIENEDHEIEIAGLVFNYSSNGAGGPEGRTSIREVRAQAEQHGWHVFRERMPYSLSIPKAARQARPVSWVDYARYSIITQVRDLNDAMLSRLNLLPKGASDETG